MANVCKQGTTASSTHAKKNFQMSEWIFTVFVYVKEVIWCMPFQSVKRNMTIESGNPRSERDLSNLHNYWWVVLLQRTAFQWWPHGTGSPIGVEGNSQTTHGFIVVELRSFLLFTIIFHLWLLLCGTFKHFSSVAAPLWSLINALAPWLWCIWSACG